MHLQWSASYGQGKIETNRCVKIELAMESVACEHESSFNAVKIGVKHRGLEVLFGFNLDCNHGIQL